MAGSFENRCRFLRDTVALIRAAAPGLDIGVRLSAVDWAPFRAGRDRVGEPTPFEGEDYPYAFGGDGSGKGYDLREPRRFLELLHDLDIQLVCITAGSPYYNFHIQRPALFPPSDGYLLPEDPLVGVARQIKITAELKAMFPAMTIVGSGYSYLQDWLPNVAQAVVGAGMTDFCGLGADGSELSGIASGFAGGKAAAAETHLSDVQRLYNGAAEWHGVGMLSLG